jgi:predicted glycogen debranching enzyme
MDAVVNVEPVTARSGKAVEVQALWYNALRTLALLANSFNEQNICQELLGMADKAKTSFNQIFWTENGQSLCDFINENGRPDNSIRPNQIIVCSLDFKLIDKISSNKIVDFVTSELLTPIGLQTLSPKDPRYIGKYEGDRSSRDKAITMGLYFLGSLVPSQLPILTQRAMTN